MDINIQTNFNIGDKVWIPDVYYEWFPIKNVHYITKIEVGIYSQGKEVFYTIKDEKEKTHEYPARLCFSSYDECKQWCDKENKCERR